jgi:hypothetical protein
MLEAFARYRNAHAVGMWFPLASAVVISESWTVMKKPTHDERRRMCTGKRRYRTQADALDAALLAGVARHRKAYLCPLCRQWHLTSA